MGPNNISKKYASEDPALRMDVKTWCEPVLVLLKTTAAGEWLSTQEITGLLVDDIECKEGRAVQRAVSICWRNAIGDWSRVAREMRNVVTTGQPRVHAFYRWEPDMEPRGPQGPAFERSTPEKVAPKVKAFLRTRRGEWFTAATLKEVTEYPQTVNGMRGLLNRCEEMGLLRGVHTSVAVKDHRQVKVWGMPAPKGAVRPEPEPELPLELPEPEVEENLDDGDDWTPYTAPGEGFYVPPVMADPWATKPDDDDGDGVGMFYVVVGRRAGGDPVLRAPDGTVGTFLPL